MIPPWISLYHRLSVIHLCSLGYLGHNEWHSIVIRLYVQHCITLAYGM